MDDSYLIVAVGNDRHWELMCKAIQAEHLLNDSRFAHNADRVKHRDELVPQLEKIYSKKPRQDWFKILTEAGVPCGPVYTMSEIFTDPQVLHRGMLLEMSHVKTGKVRLIGNPIKFSETKVKIRTPPPLLGENTDEVLKKLLNYSDSEITKLREEGAI
jgi:crotonobetainyl-CoA:carnitine CoA-transferase CaiB-like acyl-CoA transferase